MGAEPAKKPIEDMQDLAGTDVDQSTLQKQIGGYLAQQRIKKGLNLQEIADDLKIRKFFLEAIENGRFDHLPGTVYVVGFIKSYAKYLELDDVAITNALLQAEGFKPTESTFKSYGIEQSGGIFNYWFLIGTAILTSIIIGFFVYSNYFQRSSTIENATVVEDASSETVLPTASTTSISPDSFYLQVRRPTWVKITKENNELINAKMLKPGENLDITSYDGKKLTVGDASAITFYKGEKVIPFYFLDNEESGPTIIEDFTLNLKELEKKLPKEEEKP